MSSKKNKSKTKKASEGDSSLLLKEGSTDSSNLQTSSHDGGSCKSLNNNSFAVIDFIEKGKTWLHYVWQASRSVAKKRYSVVADSSPSTKEPLCSVGMGDMEAVGLVALSDAAGCWEAVLTAQSAGKDRDVFLIVADLKWHPDSGDSDFQLWGCLKCSSMMSDRQIMWISVKVTVF